MAVEPIHKRRTERTPALSFEPTQSLVTLEGECYPEDTGQFFGPLLAALDDYLCGEPSTLTVRLRLVYFNSSTAKAIMNLFKLLERAAARGWWIKIEWHYDHDDESMHESGQDFAEEICRAEFTLVPEQS